MSHLKRDGKYKYRSGEVPAKVTFNNDGCTSVRKGKGMKPMTHGKDGALRPGKATEFDLVYTGKASKKKAAVKKDEKPKADEKPPPVGLSTQSVPRSLLK